MPEAMTPDCKSVHGKVPGPKEHLLCAKHGHVVDIKTKQIIAKTLDEYKKLHHPQKMKPKPMKTDCKSVHGQVPAPRSICSAPSMGMCSTSRPSTSSLTISTSTKRRSDITRNAR